MDGKFFADSHGLKISPQDATVVAQKLSHHIHSAIFNIVSIACVTAMMNGARMVTPKHLDDVRNYIKEKCGTTQPHAQSGGSPTGFPSEYFGTMHPAYSPAHADSGVHSSQVDFAANIARPAMGPQLQSGGGADTRHINFVRLLAEVKAVFKHHHMKVSKAAAESLVRIVHFHMDCLVADLRKAGTNVTAKRLEKVLAVKRHSMFQ